MGCGASKLQIHAEAPARTQPPSILKVKGRSSATSVEPPAPSSPPQQQAHRGLHIRSSLSPSHEGSEVDPLDPRHCPVYLPPTTPHPLSSQHSTPASTESRSSTLLTIARALAAETRLHRIVGIIVSQVPELIDCDRCTLFFVDRDMQELIVRRNASGGRKKTFISWVFGQCEAPSLPFQHGEEELRLPMKGLAGVVASTGQSLKVDDVHLDPRFDPSMDKSTGYRTRSMLCVPMIDLKGECIGVIQAINKNLVYPGFDSADEALLLTFSAQAALSVRNSQLLSRTSAALQQADALLEVTNVLSSELKMEALIAMICNKLQQLLGCERCTVFLVHKEKAILYTNAALSYGMGPSAVVSGDMDKEKLLSFPINRGIAGAVATTGAVINLADAYDDPRFDRTVDKDTGFRTHSVLCVPVKNHRAEVVGVIQVINKQRRMGGLDMARLEEEELRDRDRANTKDGSQRLGVRHTSVAGGHVVPFSAANVRLLTAFSSQAAVAIENSRLFTETEKALNQALAEQRNLRFMLSVTKNLFSDLHLQSILSQLVQQVVALMKADHCVFFIIDQQTRDYYLANEDGSHDAAKPRRDSRSAMSRSPLSQRYPASIGFAGKVIHSGSSLRINAEAHLDPAFAADVDSRPGVTPQSVLYCPVIGALAAVGDATAAGGGGAAQQGVIGVIGVWDVLNRGGFADDEEELLQAFCAQASAAISSSNRVSSILLQSEVKDSDDSAAQYLKGKRGMKLTEHKIDRFEYRTEDLTMKGLIGVGSYGEVYRAVMIDTEQTVAVKRFHVRQLQAEQVDSFCSEASLMCQLTHPNVVAFIGAITEPSNLAIITEFCFDPTVSVWLADGSTKRVDQLLPTDRLLDELGEAIEIIPNSLIGTVAFPQPLPGQTGHAAGSLVPTPAQAGYVPPLGTTTTNPGYLQKRRISGVYDSFNDFIVSANHPLTVGTSRPAHAGGLRAGRNLSRAQAYHFPSDCSWQVGQAPPAMVGQPIWGYHANTRLRGGWCGIRPYYWDGGLPDPTRSMHPLTNPPYVMGGHYNANTGVTNYRDPRAGPVPVGGWATWQEAQAAQITDWNNIHQLPHSTRLGEFPVNVIEAMPASIKGDLEPTGQWTGQLALVKLSVPIVFPVNNYLLGKLDLAMQDCGLPIGVVDGLPYHNRVRYRAAQLEFALRINNPAAVAAGAGAVFVNVLPPEAAMQAVMAEINYRDPANNPPNAATGYQCVFPPAPLALHLMANLGQRLDALVEYILELTAWLVGLWLTDDYSLMTEYGLIHGLPNDHSAVLERCRHWIGLLGLPAISFPIAAPGLSNGPNQQPCSIISFNVPWQGGVQANSILRHLLVRCGVVVPPVFPVWNSPQPMASQQQQQQQRQQIQQITTAAEALNKPRFWDETLLNRLGWQNETVRTRRAFLAGCIDGDGSRTELDQWSISQDVAKAALVWWLCTLFRQLGFSTGQPALDPSGTKMVMQNIQHHYADQRLLPIAILHKRTVGVGLRSSTPHACSFRIEHNDGQGNALVAGPVVCFTVRKPGRPCSHRLLLNDGTITHNCAKGSLADILVDDSVPLSFAERVRIALDAARGMHYLHTSNPVILHRDLKTDNLLVTSAFSIKVADFGLTRFLSEGKQMTQVGTPMWMAPEIIQGRQYTQKADVFAFGIILWEILTRLEPYDDKEPMQIVLEVVNCRLRPTLPPEIAASPLVPLMQECWQQEPERRPSFQQCVARLEAILNDAEQGGEGEGTAAEEDGWAGGGKGWRGRTPHGIQNVWGVGLGELRKDLLPSFELREAEREEEMRRLKEEAENEEKAEFDKRQREREEALKEDMEDQQRQQQPS